MERTLFDGPPPPTHAAALGGLETLTATDLVALHEGTIGVYRLMRDGAWHSATAIIAASGQREGLRRMRELRRRYRIEKRRVGASREWEYRLCTE